MQAVQTVSVGGRSTGDVQMVQVVDATAMSMATANAPAVSDFSRGHGQRIVNLAEFRGGFTRH
jgi:hypothetical protein